MTENKRLSGDCMFVDTHAHLDEEEYSGRVDDVLAACLQVGVRRVVVQGSSLAESRLLCETLMKRPEVYGALGCHPHEAKDWTASSGDELRALVKSAGSKCVAIGEIGLDYYYDFSDHESQHRAFLEQLAIARELHLPVVIHTRDAWNDTLAILRDWTNSFVSDGLFYGVVHCWFGTPEQSRELRAMGFLMGVGGSVTFKKSEAIQASVREMPLNSFVLETDAPYLSPVPYRGKPNTPASIPLIAQAIADLRGGHESPEEIAAVTTRNARCLYGAMGLPELPAIAYCLGRSLYIALSNRCSCDCVFCTRRDKPLIHGWNLKMEQDPDESEVQRAVESWGPDFERFKEVVFCGFGEPTLRLDLLLKTAQWLKAHGARRIRINTNGHSDLINGAGSVARMKGIVDVVSVSLNATNKEDYNRLNRPDHPDEAWDAMRNFVRDAARELPECVGSAVGLPGRETDGIRAMALELGAKFRLRPYEDLSR
ncbi:YchF/TatD family DNA exonuclease [Candidatus Sumerlaeota bacterium]|nr:YchF/TatD family DNA exonuclease [Candidatus Sumerlaeota bacterium]